MQDQIGRRYHPVPDSGATRQSDSTDWSDLRSLWYGRHKDVLTRIIQEKFDPKVAVQMTLVYADLLGWLRRHKCASTLKSTVWEFSGGGAQWGKAQRSAMATAMAVAHIAGMCWLHLVRRKNTLRLEVLWGHQVEFVVDPEAPAELQLCSSIAISAESGKTVYRRNETGAVDVYVVNEKGEETLSGTMPYYPILGLYRDDYDTVAPGLRQTWLAAQRNAELTLTDIEHHRHNLPSQRWVIGLDGSDLADLPMGPNTVLPLPPGAGIQCGEWSHPAGMIESDIAGLESVLRFLAVLEGISPETISIRSAAETGAAKAIDAMPAWDLRLESWQYCQDWADEITAWCNQLLAYASMPPFTIAIPKPVQPPLGDPRSEVQADKEKLEMGTVTIEELRAKEEARA